jgi:hypothetical protein
MAALSLDAAASRSDRQASKTAWNLSIPLSFVCAMVGIAQMVMSKVINVFFI